VSLWKEVSFLKQNFTVQNSLRDISRCLWRCPAVSFTAKAGLGTPYYLKHTANQWDLPRGPIRGYSGTPLSRLSVRAGKLYVTPTEIASKTTHSPGPTNSTGLLHTRTKWKRKASGRLNLPRHPPSFLLSAPALITLAN
jgi:hypothetical protein